LANNGSAFKVLFAQTNPDLNNRTDAFGTTVTP